MNHLGAKSIFYIDSQNRTSETSGNFSISLLMPPHNNYNRMMDWQIKARFDRHPLFLR